MPANFDGSGLELCKLNTTLTIENATIQKFSVYPNPSENGQFSIEAKDKISEIKVFDMLGKSISVQFTGVNTFQIVASSGIYQLVVTSEENKEQLIKLVLK